MSNLSCYRLEQLARLGLHSQLFVPAFLQEMHHHISSISNTFCWQTTNGNLNNVYDESSNVEVIKEFVLAISNTHSDKYSHAIDWINSLDKPVSSFEFYGTCPYIAEFYKSVLLPLGYVNSCFVPIILDKTKKRLGVLILHRKRREPEFTKKERDYLKHIAGILAYGLVQPVSEHSNIADGWQQGLLTTDHVGKIEQCCPTAEKLIILASASRFGAHSIQSSYDINIFKDLEILIRELKSSSRSKSIDCNPTLTINNDWGKFILHGFLIEDKMSFQSQKLGFSIRWQEPFVLKLFHRIKILNLTPRQETVGLLYAKGDPQQMIADKLNLSIHTVKEHVKNFSDRLNIQSRGDLIERILCD